MTKKKVQSSKKKNEKRETIKITPMYFEMLNSGEIHGLLGEPLPPKISYCLARVMNKIQPEASIYFEERDKLLRQYKDEEKSKGLPEGQIKVLENKLDEFNDKDKELKNTEIDLGIQKIEIEFAKMPKLSATQWRFLLPMFTEV